MKVKTIKGVLDSNTFIIILPDNVVYIVDAGAPLDAVKKQLGNLKPSAILITHGHYDHIYHLDDYITAFKCPVFRHHATDNCPVQFFHAPGHSADSMVYLINGHLFTGDVLFADTIGRTDFMKNGDQLMQKSLQMLQNVKFDVSHHGHYVSSSYNDQIENIKSFLID